MAKVKKRKTKKKAPKRLPLTVGNSYQSLKALNTLYQESKDVFEPSIKALISNSLTFKYFGFKSQDFSDRLHKTQYIVTSKHVRQVIFLILEILKKSSDELRLHLKYKSDIEYLILLSMYDEALAMLEEHRSEFGLSYWYFENLFGVLSRLGKKNEAYEVYVKYAEHLTDVESRDLNLLLERSNKSISSERFEFIINSLIDSIDQNSADKRMLNFLFNFDASEEYDIKVALEFSLKLNLPDVYNILSRSLAYLSVNSGSHFKDLYDLNAISSPSGVSESQFRKLFDNEYVSSEYIESLRAYLSGNNESSLSISNSRVSKDPRNHIDFDILSKSCSLLKKDYLAKDVVSEFLSSCVRYLASYRNDDLENAKKITQQFNNINSLQYVNILRSKEVDSFLSDRSENIKRYLYLLSMIEGTEFLEEDLDLHITNLRAFKPISLPKYRENKWDTDFYFDDGKFQLYVDNILDINEYPAHMINEIIEKSIYAKYKLDDIDGVVDDIVKFYVLENITIKPDFLSRIYDPEKFVINRGEEKSIVFFYILYKAKVINVQRLALNCDSFMKINQISSFESYHANNKFGQFILTNVISLDVIKKQRKKQPLDPLIVRANILKNVGKFSNLSDANKREIDRLTREYARKISLVSFGNGKVHVNEDYLVDEMYQLLYDEYLLVEHSAKLERDLLLNIENSSVDTKTHELASDFLYKARDIYTVNEKFGIENSLNTHFRHNSIVPALRASLTNSNLDCTLLSGVYTDNKMLEDRFKHAIKKQAYDDIQSYAKVLSENIDSELNFLKDKYLHVDLNDIQDKDMLFRYDVSRDDVFNLVSLVVAGTTYDDVLIWCMSLFKKKTENLLIIGKHHIKSTLCAIMLKELSHFKDNLSVYIDDGDLVFTKISEAEDRILSTCREVAEWFAFVGRASEDFQISTPIVEALEFVDKTTPSRTITHNLEMEENFQLKGKYLFSLINIFIILFQNAAKSNHSQTHVDLRITQEDETTIQVTVKNRYDMIDLEKILEISRNIAKNEFLKGASQNTGSGIYKVCRLMDIEMRNVTGLTLDVDESVNELSVSWIMATGFEAEL